MFFSRTWIKRGVTLGVLLAVGYMLYRRGDAIIDNYHRFYDFALGVHVIRSLFDGDQGFDQRWDDFDRQFHGQSQRDPGPPPVPRRQGAMSGDGFHTVTITPALLPVTGAFAGDWRYHTGARAGDEGQLQRHVEAAMAPVVRRSDAHPKGSEAHASDFDRRFTQQWRKFDQDFQAQRNRQLQRAAPPAGTPPAPAPPGTVTSQARPPAPVQPPSGDPGYKAYEDRSIVKPVPTPPVPYVAEEYTVGYYAGLLSFLLRIRILKALGILLLTILLIVLWRRRRRAKAQRVVTAHLSEAD